MSAINSKSVRYIKLGEAGRWEKECIEKGIIRFGFGSAKKGRYELCRAGKWQALTHSFLRAGRSQVTATRFTNKTRRFFFEDKGDTLWITFVGERLWWGMPKPAPAVRHPDGDGVLREVAGGWKSADINGEALTKERLSGALTKLAAYRGTSCDVDVADYTIRRINGKKLLEVEVAIKALNELTAATVGLMQLLGDRDFELRIDLVFFRQRLAPARCGRQNPENP